MRQLVRLLILSLCFAPLLAGSDLSFFGGYMEAGSFNVQGIQLDLNDFGVVGVRFEPQFGKFFGFENTLAFTSDSLTIPPFAEKRGLYYTANLVANLPVGRVVPNVTAGIGYLYRFGTSVPDLDSSFLFNYGGGIKVRDVIGPVGFRVDVRRFNFRSLADDDANTTEVSGGVMIRF